MTRCTIHGEQGKVGCCEGVLGSQGPERAAADRFDRSEASEAQGPGRTWNAVSESTRWNWGRTCGRPGLLYDEGACCRGAVVKSVTHLLFLAFAPSPSDLAANPTCGTREAKLRSFG